MSEQRPYVFEFVIVPSGGKPRRYTRAVPVEQLWEKFNLACEWRRQSEAHNASFYGPGIMKTVCDEYARQRLREILEPQGLLPEEPVYIGLLWADLDGNGYGLFKVRKETHELEGFERPFVSEYLLEYVAPDKIEPAFSWAEEMLWRPRAIWMGQPALIFCFAWIRVEQALREIPSVARLLHEGQVLLAPAAYDWRGADNRPYPYIKPARSRARIQEYRRRYPTAEDCMWTPGEVLRSRHGLGAKGMFVSALGLPV